MAGGDDALFVARYADADIHGRLAPILRKHGCDARSAVEADNDKLEDEAQLAHATSQGRAILSFNQKDFMPLHRKWQQTGRSHAGILCSPHIALGELLRRMLRLLNHVSKDEMRDTLQYLSDFAERQKDADPARE